MSPIPKRGEQVKVFVVLKEGETGTEEEFLTYCKDKLAAYKLPTMIEFRDDLPKTNVGKVLKKDLTRMSLYSVTEDTPRECTGIEHLRHLTECSPFGISIANEDLVNEYLNPKFTEIFGYTLEDIPTKGIWFEKAYPDPAYRERVLQMWRADTEITRKTGTMAPRTFKVRCKDGRDKMIRFRAVDMGDGKQLLTYEDRTAEIAAEIALKASEEAARQEAVKLSSMISGMEEGVVFADSDNRVVEVNEYFCNFVGNAKKDILGQTLEAFHSGEILKTGHGVYRGIPEKFRVQSRRGSKGHR